MLSIEAENAAGSVRTVVASRVTGSAYTGRDDMSKMFGDVSEAPDIYTLKNTFSVTANAEMTPVSVSVLAARQGEVATLPLCIRTSYEGEIALHLTGMSRYEAEIALIDRYTDVQADLTGRETYDYTFSHIPKRSGGEVVATEDRFVLQMQYTGATGQMPVAAAVGSVWVNGGDGTVEAFAASPLQRLTVYNLQGAEIRTATPVGATQVTLSGFKPGFYIVRVWTDGGVVSKKLIIK